MGGAKSLLPMSKAVWIHSTSFHHLPLRSSSLAFTWPFAPFLHNMVGLLHPRLSPTMVQSLQLALPVANPPSLAGLEVQECCALWWEAPIWVSCGVFYPTISRYTTFPTTKLSKEQAPFCFSYRQGGSLFWWSLSTTGISLWCVVREGNLYKTHILAIAGL